MTNRYIPNTPEDRSEMLEAIGVGSIEDLWKTIPEDLRLKSRLRLPSALPEPDLLRHLKNMSGQNSDVGRFPSFLGAGAYNHYIPSAVNHLASQPGFYTAYTPYQPEVSQGILQAIFEFQSYITLLAGLDVANASMYDGPSAAAEAVLMAKRVTKRDEVIIPRNAHPEYRQVIETYIRDLDMKIVEAPFLEDGRIDYDAVKKSLNDKTAALVVQNPNFFGCVETPEAISQSLRENCTLLIQTTVEALSLAILKSPGECGADIFAGEGQSFGNPLSFGGPYVGLFAARKDFIRNMPGRLVGETLDKKGKRGYVLTLSTREQHIRRDRATSNICSNQSLCAIRSAIYLSTLGKKGVRGLALMNMRKAAYMRKKISSLPGYRALFSAPVFNEFVAGTPVPPEEINEALEKEGIIGGLDLGKFYPELGNAMLFCATEMVRKEDMDRLVDVLSRY
ncbi:MAG: aminomethyl-transferring glycine dehydrogenase subunit GcvPA [Nitrospinae bacterium]|nr:aminomethyl-transferring glycine dehydrogenase subunit GcvPA [Nitrospinota bacterium]